MSDAAFSSGPAALAGLDPDKVELLRSRVELEIERGWLPSAQYALAVDGRLEVFESVGKTSGRTRYVLQSAGRPILASIVWKLMSDDALDVSAAVADIIPEFATNGKEIVTVEQVLTHRAGLARAPIRYPDMIDRAKRLEAMGRWRLTAVPGEHVEYHLTSSGWIIAEIVERLTGLDLPTYVRRVIAEPLGLDTIELGVPVERQDGTVAPFVAVDVPEGTFEVDPFGPWVFDDPAFLAAGEPSHAFVATARDVALLFQAMYHHPMWNRTVVRDAARTRVSAAPAGDSRYGGSEVTTNFALFVNVRGDLGRPGLPASSSPAAFGHLGASSQFCFMDPETGLSFAFLTNGYPATGYDSTARGQNRMSVIGELAADCLRR
jgi:CubicO group peptidase (beta-lactamase class C family)